MLALCKLNPDELERDLLLDQDESGAAGGTGGDSSVEFEDHGRELREELRKRETRRPGDPNVVSRSDPFKPYR